MQDVRTFNKDVSTCSALLYSKPKAERKVLVEVIMDFQVLIWVIRCFYADPVLAFTVSCTLPCVHVISQPLPLSSIPMWMDSTCRACSWWLALLPSCRTRLRQCCHALLHRYSFCITWSIICRSCLCYALYVDTVASSWAQVHWVVG